MTFTLGRLTRAWIYVAIAACVIAPSLLFAEPASARGPVFEALRTSGEASLADIPAYRLRTYIAGAIAELTRACPQIAAPDVSAMRNQVTEMIGRRQTQGFSLPPDQGASLAILALQRATSDSAFVSVNSPREDMRAWTKQMGCGRDTTTLVERFKSAMARPELVGSIEQTVKGVCERFSPSAKANCACFASTVDLELTPATRRQFLAAPDKRSALQGLVKTRDLQTALLLTCPGIPPLDGAGGTSQADSGPFPGQRRILPTRLEIQSAVSPDERAAILQHLESLEQFGLEIVACSYSASGKEETFYYYAWPKVKGRVPTPTRSQLQQISPHHPFLVLKIPRGASLRAQCPGLEEAQRTRDYYGSSDR